MSDAGVDEAPVYRLQDTQFDVVNNPAHYTWMPNGIEVIDITEHLNFCRGNAVKYILRSGHKGAVVEDLKKAAWYIAREIDRLEKGRNR